MCYTEIKMTERIKRVRKTYLTLPVPRETNAYEPEKYVPFGTGDRWLTLGYLRGWRDHFDATTTLLRNSLAEAEELHSTQPVIYEDELLLGHLYLPDYTEEEWEEYHALCESFVMSHHTLLRRSPRKCHIGLNFEKLLQKGIRGIKEDIQACREKLNPNDVNVYPDYEVIRKLEFYECLDIELDAVLHLADRYAEKAREMANTATSKRKEELLTLANILSRVPAEPATTFYEAIQSIQFFLSTLFGLFPLGRPDRYLYKFYEQDIKNGTLTKEFAQELVDNFCLYVSDRVFSRSACGFIVGGEDKDGKLVENDLTYMFLTALDHLQLPDPNGALAVNEKTSDEILAYAAKILSKGTTHPAFYNDRVIIDSFMQNYGVAKEDATDYIHATCAEMSIAGKSKSHSTPFEINMPKMVYETAKENPDCFSLNAFLEIFVSKMKSYVQFCAFNYIRRMLDVSRNGNERMRTSALIDDCIARGKSIYEGGERYTFLQPIFIGFSTAIDSLYALKKFVFEEKKLSLAAFCTISENNFENEETFRQHIINKLPHYGNDQNEIDTLAKQVADRIAALLKEDDIPGGAMMMPGTFSYINHATHGKLTGATFDGRLAGTAFSDGCSPVQGRDTNGPTAMVKSLTSWDQSQFLGGMVVNMKLGKENLTEEKIQNFISVLKTFIARGGIEMQVNIVDRETLSDALKNPDAHADLLVRIGGYSDYFIRLSPTLQQEIINRTQY